MVAMWVRSVAIDAPPFLPAFDALRIEAMGFCRLRGRFRPRRTNGAQRVRVHGGEASTLFRTGCGIIDGGDGLDW